MEVHLLILGEKRVHVFAHSEGAHDHRPGLLRQHQFKVDHSAGPDRLRRQKVHLQGEEVPSFH